MSSTNKTENYNLPQWIGTDKPTFLGDFNGAFLSIDQGIYEAKTLAENASEIATQANTSATNNAPRLAKAESDITTLKAGLTNVQNLQEINKITREDKTFRPTTSESGITIVFDTALGQNPITVTKITIPNVGKVITIKGYLTLNVSDMSGWTEKVESITIPGIGDFVGADTAGTGNDRVIYDAGYILLSGYKPNNAETGNWGYTGPLGFRLKDNGIFAIVPNGILTSNSVELYFNKTFIA